jgi:hypothetical protein
MTKMIKYIIKKYYIKQYNKNDIHITLKVINGNTYFFILTDSIYIEYRLDGKYLEISFEDEESARIRIKEDNRKILSFFFRKRFERKIRKDYIYQKFQTK